MHVNLENLADAQSIADNLALLPKEALLYIAGYAEGRRDRPARFQSTHPARGATANFTKEQRVCLAQFAYLHKGKKAEHTKTNAPMLH